MPWVVGIFWGLAVFGFWLLIAGSSSLFTTLLGLFVGVFSGFWVYWKLNQLIKNRQ